MENQNQGRPGLQNEEQNRDENLFTRDNQNDFSSGPLMNAANEDDMDQPGRGKAASDDRLEDEEDEEGSY